MPARIPQRWIARWAGVQKVSRPMDSMPGNIPVHADHATGDGRDRAPDIPGNAVLGRSIYLQNKIIRLRVAEEELRGNDWELAP